MNQTKKILCKCERYYHDPKYDRCWECWATQPKNTFKHYKNLKTNQEYNSVKDYNAITGNE